MAIEAIEITEDIMETLKKHYCEQKKMKAHQASNCWKITFVEDVRQVKDILKSWNYLVWKGHLEGIWSNHLLKAQSAYLPETFLSEFWISLRNGDVWLQGQQPFPVFIAIVVVFFFPITSCRNISCCNFCLLFLVHCTPPRSIWFPLAVTSCYIV